MKKILYIGWIGYNNLGDELMYDLFKEQLQLLPVPYKLDLVNNEIRYLSNVSIEPYDAIVLGGGSILSDASQPIQPEIINFLYQAIQAEKQVMIWGSGTDWLSQETLAQLQADAALDITVPETLQEKFRTVFTEAAWSGVRGPLTKRLFTKLTALEHIPISGDPGFLLKKPKHPKQAPQQKTIGVNWGTAYNNVYGENEQYVEDALAKALNAFIDQGYAIYLYTVWGEDLAPTQRLYEKLTKKEHVTFDETLYHHDDLLVILASFDFTINFKLHANYLSLAARVPFIALGYRFKIFDFAQSINLGELVIPMSATSIDNKIQALAEHIQQNRTSIIETMTTHQKEYAKRLSVPFKENLF